MKLKLFVILPVFLLSIACGIYALLQCKELNNMLPNAVAVIPEQQLLEFDINNNKVVREGGNFLVFSQKDTFFGQEAINEVANEADEPFIATTISYFAAKTLGPAICKFGLILCGMALVILIFYYSCKLAVKAYESKSGALTVKCLLAFILLLTVGLLAEWLLLNTFSMSKELMPQSNIFDFKHYVAQYKLFTTQGIERYAVMLSTSLTKITISITVMVLLFYAAFAMLIKKYLHKQML